MIKFPGRQATRLEQLLISNTLLAKKHPQEELEDIIVHHISEDTTNRLQVEVERRSPSGISFERIVL